MLNRLLSRSTCAHISCSVCGGGVTERNVINVDSHNICASYTYTYDNECQAIGTFVHYRCAAAAELMSVASSPGRAWPIFFTEHRLPIVAAATATRFPHGGAFVAGL